MIYAIPHNRNCVANHFMKATQFAFIDQNSTLINHIENPASPAHSSCHDKKTLISMIKEMKADAVIVRNIGERSLGKLLSAGIRVFRVSSQTPLSEAVTSKLEELTNVTQGRPSTNHQKKGGCSHGESGCGCGGHEQHQQASHGLNLHKAHRKGQAMRMNLNTISSLKPFDK